MAYMFEIPVPILTVIVLCFGGLLWAAVKSARLVANTETSIELSPIHAACERAARMLGLFAALIGLIILVVGWGFDIAAVRRAFPNDPEMMPATALLLLLFGLLVFFDSHLRAWRKTVSTASIVIGAVSLIGLCNLVRDAARLKTPVNHALLNDGFWPSLFACKMAPPTAISFLLLAFALVAWHRKRGISLAQYAVIAAGTMALLNGIAFLYGVRDFYRLLFGPGMAVPTSAAVLALSLAFLLSRPSHGLISVVTSTQQGGVMARRMLPAAFLVPALLGWLRWQGQVAGYYDAGFGLCLHTSANILVFASLIWMSASSLNRLAAERSRAEERTRFAEERLLRALDFAGVAAWTWTIGDDGIHWDGPAEKLFGVPAKDLAHYATIQSLIVPEFKDDVDASLKRSLEQGTSFLSEFQIVRPDGQLRWILGRGGVSLDENGQVIRMAGIDFDVTDTKAVEHRLAESERLLRERDQQIRLVFDKGGIGSFTWNLETDEVIADASVWKIYGKESVNPATLPAHLLRERQHPDDTPVISYGVQKMLDTREPLDVEFRVLQPDGSVRWLVCRAAIVQDSGGKPVRVTGINIDVTELKQAQLRAVANEQRSRELAAERDAILSQLAEGIIAVDAEGRIVLLNDAAATIHGVGLLPVTPDQYSQAYGLFTEEGEPYPAAELPLARALNGEVVTDARWLVRRPDGQEVVAIGSARPVFADDGRRIGAVLAVRDDTERRRAELERERLVSVIENSSDFIGISDTQGVPIYVNRAGQALVGAAGMDECRNTPVTDYFAFDDREFVKTVVLPIVRDKGAWKGELRFQHFRTGQPITVIYDVFRIDDPRTGKPVNFATVTRDITEQKRAEKALRESEQRFRELADAMPQIVWTATGGKIDYYNQRWYKFAAADPADPNPPTWRSISHPDDVAETERKWNDAVAAGSSYETECRLFDSASGTYLWHLVRAVALRDENGRVIRWLGTCTDIHDKKTEAQRLEAEVSSRTEQLRRSLLEKETLLKEVHHRVKNNLQVISSLLKMQSASLDDATAVDALKESQQRVLSMALIHERLYGSRHMDQVDFAEYSEALVNELFYSYETGAGRVARRLKLSRVFLNIDQAIPCGLILNELVSNALKYAHPGGRSGEILIELDYTPARNIALTVADDGVGLPEHFDWKDSKSLGLPIVEILAKQLGGRLSVRRQPGASFTVEFPAASGRQNAA